MGGLYGAAAGRCASGGMQNGYYNTGDGRIYVNTQSGDPAVQVISHELTHSIEKSRFYAKLQQVVLKKIKADGLDLDTLRTEKQALYERHGVADVDTDSEIVAEYVAKNLLTDEQSIRNLVMESQTLGQRIMEFIDQLLAMLGNKNAQERELLSKARRYYQKALADSWGQEATMRQGWFNGGYDSELDWQNGLGGNRYSIGKTTSNKPFVEVEQDILAGVPRTEWVSTVKENLNQKFPNGVTVGNNEINIDRQSRQEMTFSRYMQWLYNHNPQMYADKLRATNNADEILFATTDWVNEGPKHPRKDRIVDFARGNVLLRLGGNDYTANVVVGTRKNGSMVLYDVLNLQSTSFAGKETDAAIATNPSPGADRNTASVSPNSILESQEFGNRKFSISEEKNFPELYRAQLTDIQNGLRGKQYSISETDDGRVVAVVDNDILADFDTTTWDKAKKERAKAAAKAALLAHRDGVQVNGVNYKVNRTSRREFTRSKDTEWLYRRKPEIFSDKMRTADVADDVITATTDWARDGKLNHPRTDDFVDFEHGNVLIQAGANQYDARTVVGITKRGEYVFYDIVDMAPTNFQMKEELSTTAAGKNAISDIQESSSQYTIAESPEFGNRKFSISEEKNFPELYQAQLRALERLNLAASKEYDGYVEQLNRYKLQLRAKEVLEEYYAAVHENEEAINELKNAYRDWVLEQNLNWEEQEGN